MQLIILCFLAWLFTTDAQAQQASRELQALQETTNSLYRSGRYAEALEAAERALPLAMREYGSDHEQTGIQTYTLGLVSAAAGNLPAAEKYYAQTLHIREKVYGPDSAAVALALESLGQVFVRTGRLSNAEPLFKRALKIREDLVGRDHAFSATAHSNLGDVSLARGDWPAALTSYRQAIRLLVSQDKSSSVVSSLVEEEINRHRDTFVGLCRAAWQTRSDARTSKAAVVEETFSAAQHAWHTAAATALAKMSARLGAGNTDLGRAIRRLQDLSARVLAISAEDQKLLADWSAVQRADRNYSALLEEFRALSIARSKDNAPFVKQQQALVEQMTALLERCPPGQKKAGCEASDRERQAIGKQLAELSKATAAGADKTTEVHRRMEAAEKELLPRLSGLRPPQSASVPRPRNSGSRARFSISIASSNSQRTGWLLAICRDCPSRRSCSHRRTHRQKPTTGC
jgi:tetratricopeptide (TPR) repeat protein